MANLSLNNSTIGQPEIDFARAPTDRDILLVVQGIPAWAKCRRCSSVLSSENSEIRFTNCGCRGVCRGCYEQDPICLVCHPDRRVTADSQASEVIVDSCEFCKNKKLYWSACLKNHVVTTKVFKSHDRV